MQRIKIEIKSNISSGGCGGLYAGCGFLYDAGCVTCGILSIYLGPGCSNCGAVNCNGCSGCNGCDSGCAGTNNGCNSCHTCNGCDFCS